MSIVSLVKVTVYGLLSQKEQVIADLQELGCLHLVSLGLAEENGGLGPTPQARAALQFLLTAPQQRRQVHDPSRFDPTAVERQVLELKDKLQELEDEHDFLRRRITDLTPWGDFTLPPEEELGYQRLWFYIVPLYLMKKVEATDLVWQEVHRDNRFAYVVVLSRFQPEGMPVTRTRTGRIPLHQLQRRLEEVLEEIEDRRAERVSLTRWRDLFAGCLSRLEDAAARVAAAHQTHDDSPLFALQAWTPRKSLPALEVYAREHSLALVWEEPADDDTPPTLLANPPRLAGGQDLVSFYMMPGYRTWDPSIIVFFSFVLFFAMILNDAGYAFLLGLVLLWGWRRLGASQRGRQLRVLATALVGTAAAWGIFAGSYFGVSPASGTLLGRLKLFDVADSAAMMRLSVGIGIAHVALANAIEAWRRRGSPTMLAPLGWIAILGGGAILALGNDSGLPTGLGEAGPWLLGIGGLAVLLFTSAARVGTRRSSLGKRLMGGLLGLTRVTAAFGDVLSYLRLFALGLAGASLAIAFNGLAQQVDAAMPGIGKLLAFGVLVIGHGLNLILGIVSGVVHGLRLNFIEFFNWGIPEEGVPFRAFAKKEAETWIRGS